MRQPAHALAPGAPLFGDARDDAFAAMLDAARLCAVLAVLLVLSTAPLGLIMKTLGPDSPLAPANWVVVWGAGAALIALWPGAALRGAAASWPLLLLLAWAWASLAWSIAPRESAIDATTVTAGAAAAVAAAALFSWRRLIDIAFWMYAGLAVATVLLAFGAPSIGVMQDSHAGAWSGPWLEKNSTGRHMAIALSFALARFAHFPETRPTSGALAALGLAIVVRSTSKTAGGTALLGAGLVRGVWTLRRGPALAIVALYGGLLAAAAAAIGVYAFREELIGLMGRDLTLTGRTDIWESVWRRIQERPWRGYGFEAFWAGDDPTAPMNWVVQHAGFRPNNAHSAWLEIWLTLGLVGLALQALYLLWGLVWMAASVMRSAGAYLALPYLVTTLVASNVESLLFSPSALEWTFVVLLITKTVLERSQAAP